MAKLPKRENSYEDYTKSFAIYIRKGTGIDLRHYQLMAARAVLDSIMQGLGLSFVVLFPRQSGKDELLACLKLTLMTTFQWTESSLVEVNPTYKPQTVNAIQRLELRLRRHLFSQRTWSKRSDFIRQVGLCRTSFLSGDGQANVVGATASLLLIINEAQDIAPGVYDKNFAPMCASTNATRLFCGTAWTSTTLLARELRRARLLQEADGLQRLFMVDADEVARLHPPYGKHVAAQVQALGRQNPLVRTQYFNEEIDAQAGMFNETRMGLIFGAGKAIGPGTLQERPLYAFLMDVAGQDETPLQLDGLGNPGRDSTTLSIVEIDLSTLATLQAPSYRVVRRLAWQGVNHLGVFGQVQALAREWNPQRLVIDATGVGEGLWALLDHALPGRVIPVRFSQQEKSEIGWRFLAIIETGRFQDLSGQELARQQYAACQSEILPGPGKTLRWGVPDGVRGPDGELVHDDALLADALVAVLDRLSWSAPVRGGFVMPEGSGPPRGRF